MKKITVIGGGLAGCEAAWQAAQRGVKVDLYEMRPHQTTPAHITGDLAELVCSNSLGSSLPTRPSGLLQSELREMESLLIKCAHESSIPAGGALAIDRKDFSRRVTENIANHRNISLHRRQVSEIPDEPTICASGPLTSADLSNHLSALLGKGHLFFYDAIAPIVELETIDQNIAFRASRFDRGTQDEGDYLNCAMNSDQYHTFVEALVSAKKVDLKSFERAIPEGVNAGSGFFEGCLPIEVMAARGVEALAFGPLRPIGLHDPKTDTRPYAVVQLRQDNLAGTLYNMVGFQTNLTYEEQDRVFRMIPGLAQAQFARYGSMHRNTFLASPALLEASMQYRGRADLFFAGQLAGVEGYIGSIATGLVAGINATLVINGKPPVIFPIDTMIGALCNYLAHSDISTFQPMKANFGLPPPLPQKMKSKKDRNIAFCTRALTSLRSFMDYLK